MGRVGWSGNSGFHAFNLSVQLQPARIILVGFDMSIEHGLHWHGPHPSGLNNPSSRNVDRWRRAMDASAEVVEALGIQVVNCSAISALQNFPKQSLEEALDVDTAVCADRRCSAA